MPDPTTSTTASKIAARTMSACFMDGSSRRRSHARAVLGVPREYESNERALHGHAVPAPAREDERAEADHQSADRARRIRLRAGRLAITTALFRRAAASAAACAGAAASAAASAAAFASASAPAAAAARARAALAIGDRLEKAACLRI